MMAIMVAIVVVVMANDVVDIIVGFCMILVNFLGVGKCNLYYLCLVLSRMTFKGRAEVLYFRLCPRLQHCPILGLTRSVGFRWSMTLCLVLWLVHLAM